jgi:hypothetical protein
VGAYQIITPNNGDDPGVANDITNVDFAYLSHLIMNLGDLPNRYGVTLLGENGARHIVPFNENDRLFLGDCIEAPMVDGQPNPTASAISCHDGVTLMSENWADPLEVVTITAVISGGANIEGGYLYAWFDWNSDGVFLGEGEFYSFGYRETGTHTISITKTAEFLSRFNQGNNVDLNIRFRVFPEPLNPLVAPFYVVGAATNGEVEDYQLWFSPTAVTLQSILTAAPQSQAALPLIIAALMGLLLSGSFLLVKRRRLA